MKIRCSPTLIGFIKKLGGQPVVIPPTEVYTALERGVVDGYVFPAALIRDWGWEKLTKYIVNPGFYNGANVVLVNQKKWDRLPDSLQKILIESEDEAARFAKERSVGPVKEAKSRRSRRWGSSISISRLRRPRSWSTRPIRPCGTSSSRNPL